MSKTKSQANNILSGFAGTKEHDKIRAVRTFCNSDSAFVEWARKSAYSIDAIRNARLIQQAWKLYGNARSILITYRAVKAALIKLTRGEIVGRLKMAEALDLLQSLSGKKSTKSTAPVTTAASSVTQQELFA